MIIAVAACSNKEAAVRQAEPMPQDTPFLADNDIAMTVCSIVDAVRVGEPLDSTGYNFLGILTDGQGTPLYTDVEGEPGEWRVAVVNDVEACISNRRVGDLMTDDLRQYILGSLGLNSADLVSAYENPHKEGEIIWLYDIGDVKVSFSSFDTKSPSGIGGSLMTIKVFK